MSGWGNTASVGKFLSFELITLHHFISTLAMSPKSGNATITTNSLSYGLLKKFPLIVWLRTFFTCSRQFEYRQQDMTDLDLGAGGWSADKPSNDDHNDFDGDDVGDFYSGQDGGVGVDSGCYKSGQGELNLGSADTIAYMWCRGSFHS
jgi:hypothetical protein